MPSTDSPALIVARFLKANHYTQTLEAFLQETGVSEDDVTLNSNDWTIEKILEEKKQFDASLTYEKKDNEVNHGWTTPAPSVALSPEIPASSNVLCVRGDPFSKRILTTHADRKLHVISGQPPYSIIETISDNDSPILSLTHVTNRQYLSTAMSGEVTFRYGPEYQIIDKVRDHLKYAVTSAISVEGDSLLIATAGWDQKVIFYHTSATNLVPDKTLLGSPIHTITLPTVPESILFVRHPDTHTLYLVFSRRDSTFLYYYSITMTNGHSPKISEAGRQNLAPHSNAWVSFTPSSLAAHPFDLTLLAVATSHQPHMKLILVRLLFPSPSATHPSSSSSQIGDAVYPSTQAAQRHSALALQNREENAITLHISTLAPQTPYSTPCVVWRPDGSGVWVNGDDGAVRGVDVVRGKVVSVLKESDGGHEVGSKVRTLWSGYLGDEGREGDGDGKEGKGRREVLVSGGFDKRVVVWECKEEGGRA